MKALGVDTATEVLAIGVMNGKEAAFLTLRRGLQHEPALLPLADRLMAAVGLAIRDIELLVCSVGPGSFTGIRIGLATLQGISSASGCPLVGVSSLDVLARPWACFEGDLWAVIDARKGNWYAACFRKGARASGYLDAAPGELRERIRREAARGTARGAAPGGVPEASRVMLVGPDAPRGLEAIFGRESSDGPVVSDLYDPASLLAAGIERFEREGANPGSLSPLYLRKSEAELAAEALARSGDDR